MSQQRPSFGEISVYAHEYIKHANQSKAFCKAFPKSKASTKTLQSKAAMFHHLKVVQNGIKRLQDDLKGIEREVHQEIIKENLTEFHISVEERRKLLATAIKLGFKKKKDARGNEVPHSISGAVSAINELNKMYGDHAAVKHQISGDKSCEPISIISKKDLSSASDDAIKKALELLKCPADE